MNVVVYVCLSFVVVSFVCGVSVCLFVFEFCYLCCSEVKGIDLVENTELLYKKYVDHPKMKHLNMGDIIQDAKNKTNNVDQFHSDLEQAPLPCQCHDARVNFNKLLDNLAVSMRLVLRYRAGLLALKAEATRKILETKRSWRGKRDGMVNIFKILKVPIGLAKKMADTFCCILFPPKDVHLQMVFEERLFKNEADTNTVAYYNDGRKIPNDAVDTWLSKQVPLFYEANKDKIEVKRKENMVEHQTVWSRGLARVA